MGNSRDQKLDSWWGWKSQGSLTHVSGSWYQLPVIVVLLHPPADLHGQGIAPNRAQCGSWCLLRPEPRRTASLLMASLLLHSICPCTSQSQSVSERRKTVPLGRTGSFHQGSRSRTGDVRIRRGVRWCYVLGRDRLTVFLDIMEALWLWNTKVN